MANEKFSKVDLSKAVIRICPACGVVNPAGPSESCQHLQLVRFTGLDDDIIQQLTEVAQARSKFDELVSSLKAMVMHAVNTGTAEVVPTRTGKFSDVSRLRPPVGAPLSLEHPKPPTESAPKKKPRRRLPVPPPVDPRQLELIANEPAKGDA
jgi:hypothetical protein